MNLKHTRFTSSLTFSVSSTYIRYGKGRIIPEPSIERNDEDRRTIYPEYSGSQFSSLATVLFTEFQPFLHTLWNLPDSQGYQTNPQPFPEQNGAPLSELPPEPVPQPKPGPTPVPNIGSASKPGCNLLCGNTLVQPICVTNGFKTISFYNNCEFMQAGACCPQIYAGNYFSGEKPHYTHILDGKPSPSVL